MGSGGLPGAGVSSAEGLAGRPRQRHFSRRALPTTLDEGGWPCLGVLVVLRLSPHFLLLLFSVYVVDCMSCSPIQSAWQRKGFEHVGSLVRLEDPTPLQLYIACIKQRFTHGSFDGRRSPACVGHGPFMSYCAQQCLQLRVVSRTDSGAQSPSREQWAENKHQSIRFRRAGRKVVCTPMGTETRSGNAHT